MLGEFRSKWFRDLNLIFTLAEEHFASTQINEFIIMHVVSVCEIKF